MKTEQRKETAASKYSEQNKPLNPLLKMLGFCFPSSGKFHS